MLNKMSEKLRGKFPASCSMVKVVHLDDRSITAAKRKEKEKKERERKGKGKGKNQNSKSGGEALRDNPNNGCEGD